MTAMVVDGGLAILTNRLVGSGTEPKYVGWGTSSQAEAHDDADLVTPAAEARVSGTSSRVQTTVANDTHQVVGQITCSGSTKTIREVGLFDGAGSGSPPSGDNLFMRAVHGDQSLDPGDAIEYTIKTAYASA